MISLLWTLLHEHEGASIRKLMIVSFRKAAIFLEESYDFGAVEPPLESPLVFKRKALIYLLSSLLWEIESLPRGHR